MVNIWEFLLQTVSVSLVAGLILIVKNIFKDKLTPRWQYGIWGLLILRIFLPVKADKLVLLPFGIYLEMLKSYKLNVLAFSPSLTEEKAARLGVRIRPVTDMAQAKRCLSGSRTSDGFGELAAKGALALSLEALTIDNLFAQRLVRLRATEEHAIRHDAKAAASRLK